MKKLKDMKARKQQNLASMRKELVELKDVAAISHTHEWLAFQKVLERALEVQKDRLLTADASNPAVIGKLQGAGLAYKKIVDAANNRDGILEKAKTIERLEAELVADETHSYGEQQPDMSDDSIPAEAQARMSHSDHGGSPR